MIYNFNLIQYCIYSVWCCSIWSHYHFCFMMLSALVQVKASCLRASSYNLNQCSPSSVVPYDVTIYYHNTSSLSALHIERTLMLLELPHAHDEGHSGEADHPKHFCPTSGNSWTWSYQANRTPFFSSHLILLRCAMEIKFAPTWKMILELAFPVHYTSNQKLNGIGFGDYTDLLWWK